MVKDIMYSMYVVRESDERHFTAINTFIQSTTFYNQKMSINLVYVTRITHEYYH